MTMTSRQRNTPASHPVVSVLSGQRGARAFDGADGIGQIMQGAGGA